MAALEQALDVAYEVQTDRGFLSRRVRAVPLMVVTLVLGGASSALMVFGAPLGAGIEGHVPVHGVAFTVVWTVARWALAALRDERLLLHRHHIIGPYPRKDPLAVPERGGHRRDGHLSGRVAGAVVLRHDVRVVRQDLRKLRGSRDPDLLALPHRRRRPRRRGDQRRHRANADRACGSSALTGSPHRVAWPRGRTRQSAPTTGGAVALGGAPRRGAGRSSDPRWGLRAPRRSRGLARCVMYGPDGYLADRPRGPLGSLAWRARRSPGPEPGPRERGG